MDGIFSSFLALVKKYCLKNENYFFPKEIESSCVSDLAFLRLNRIRKYDMEYRSQADIKSKDPKLASFDQF